MRSPRRAIARAPDRSGENRNPSDRQARACTEAARSAASGAEAQGGFGKTTNFFAMSERLTISTFTRDMTFINARLKIGP